MKKYIYLLFCLGLSCSPQLDFKNQSALNTDTELSPDESVESTDTPASSSTEKAGSNVNSSSGSVSSTQNIPAFVVINEVLYDSVEDEADGNTFVELNGTPEATLAGISLQIIDGTSGKIEKTITMDNSHQLTVDGLFVICDAKTGASTDSNIQNCQLILNFDLQNGPDALLLMSPSAQTLDHLCYGFETGTQSSLDLCQGAAAIDASQGMSLSRNNSNNFQINEMPSPGDFSVSNAAADKEATPETKEVAEIGAPKVVGVFISEVVTDPQHDWNDSSGGDGIPFNAIFGNGTIGTTDEWVELKNNSSNSISIRNWTLSFVDGSDEIFVFSDDESDVFFGDGGSDSLFGSQETLVLSNPPGDMKNEIDLFLYDESNQLIDSVTIKDGNANGSEDESIVFDDEKNMFREVSSPFL